MRTRDISPRKFILQIVGITLVLTTIGTLSYWYIRNNRKTDDSQTISVSYIDSGTQSDVDTDSDGVPDWEERLWGLDPQRADTDNDGVSDAQYITNKKNIQERRNSGAENTETLLTESEKIGRSVYSAIVSIEESGGVLDEETQAQISDNIAQYVSDIPVSGILYLRDDLSLVPNTKENSYFYQENVDNLFSEYPILPEDIEIIALAIENRNDYIDEIILLERKYDILVNELAALDVPFAVGGRHTELLNSIGHISGSLKNLSQDNLDEVLLLSTIIQMEERLDQVFTAIINIQKFFEIIADESVFEE